MRYEIQLAAALLQIPVDQGDGTFGPIMSFAEAKKVTAAQIISLFERDHYPIRREQGGPDAHWNITWRPKLSHRRKSAKDKTEIEKGKRIRKAQTRHGAVMARKIGTDRIAEESFLRMRKRWPVGRKIPSRPFPKRRRPS